MKGWLVLSALVVGVDFVTKQIALAELGGRPPLELLPFLDLRLILNAGAAFGLLGTAGGWQKYVFMTVALLVAAFIIVTLWRGSAGSSWMAAALALVLGGAVGNLVDRVRWGYVVDFVYLNYEQWYWPAFNVADMAISVGAVMLVLDAVGLRPGRARA